MPKLKKNPETSTRYQKGSFEPVVYFENYRGTIAIPPSTEDALHLKAEMARKGFVLREACNLAQVQALQKTIQDQEIRIREGRLEREEHLFKQAREERRARLMQRRNSSSCSPYERDVIDAHMKHMDEKHEARVAKERAVQHYFEELEFNSSSHHLMDAVNSVPDMKDEQCTRCHKFRKVQGLTICAPCASEMSQHARS